MSGNKGRNPLRKGIISLSKHLNTSPHTHTHIHQAMSLLENSLLLVSLYTTLCLTLYLSCGVQGSKSGPSKPLRLPDDVKQASNKPSLHGQPPAKKPRPAPPTEGSSSGGLFSDPIRMSQVSLSLSLSHIDSLQCSLGASVTEWW